MKLLSLTASLAALGAMPLGAQDFIRQIQLLEPDEPPLVYDIPITGETGEVMSYPVLGDGSVFQLYAVGENPHDEQPPVKLDEKTIGAFYPVVELQIGSEDPHLPPRTRADRPYQLKIKIEGLVDDPSAPDYARMVQLERDFRLYDPKTHVPKPDGSGDGTYSDAFEFFENGEYFDPQIFHWLPGERPTKAIGEESFVMYLHPDLAEWQTQLDKATIQIWPVAEATISGIDPTERYLAVPQGVSVRMIDLYPRSVSYVRVYRGQPQLGLTDEEVNAYILPSTILSYNTFAPQNAMMRLEELERGITEDGTYTIEVLTITPFNGGAPERLAFTTFFVDRTIDVNGSTTTIED